MFNQYSLLPLVAAFLFLFQGIFVYHNGKGNRFIRLGYFFNSFVTFWWQFSWFFLFNTSNVFSANLIAKIGYVGISLIPATFFHYFVAFIDPQNYWKQAKFVYLISIFFILLIPTSFFIDGVNLFYWGYYPKAGVLHPLFLLYLFVTMGLCVYYLIKKGFLINWNGVIARQLSFLLISFLVYCLASADFLVNYGFPHYPFGVVAILISLAISAYAIVRYRLMDIKLVITRATIFIIVYSLILGIPIWFGFKLLGEGLWVLPMSLMGGFATLGPFIYFYIQKKAEDQLLQEQRAYQATLRQASAGMGRIKDLNKLLNMIVHVLTKTVRIEHSVIYIYEDINKVYKIGAVKHRSSKVVFLETIPEDHLIVEYLNAQHNSIVYEEIKQKIQDSNDQQLEFVEKLMLELQAALIVPIYINNELISFVAMGKKENSKLYNEEDLVVFSILANQVALAIENAQFYEDMKVTQEQLFQAEKMATIGIMADGLSHQINNRFHAMGFIAGDALDTIKLSRNLEMTDKLKEIMSDLERALIRVQENVTQGGEVVQGLLKYTRKGEEGFSPVAIDAVVSSAYEMAQFKIKSYQMTLVRAYDKEIMPKVKGNSTQLQEVFFNLIDNAYDAMMQRKNEFKEPEYHPTLTIRSEIQGRFLILIFEDNGTGVKEEDMQKLFTPFFTTKLSSKKGTGLGLYVIRKIIEENHRGKVEVVSKYMDGTQMKIRLPIADG